MPVRIVDIDEAALAEYGQWPWPRTVLATLVEKLAEKGAAVIAFDVIFAEPDRSSIGRVVQSLPPDEQTREMLRLAEKFPDNDEIFAEAIGARPVVTGFGFDLKGGGPHRRAASPAWRTTAARANARKVPELIAQFIPQQAGAVKTIDRAGGRGQGQRQRDPRYQERRSFAAFQCCSGWPASATRISIHRCPRRRCAWCRARRPIWCDGRARRPSSRSANGPEWAESASATSRSRPTRAGA